MILNSSGLVGLEILSLWLLWQTWQHFSAHPVEVCTIAAMLHKHSEWRDFQIILIIVIQNALRGAIYAVLILAIVLIFLEILKQIKQTRAKIESI